MDDASPPPIASIDEDWLTIHAAARRLGVTPTAIRNRIKRGTLQTRPNGNFGRLVRVPLRLVRVPPTVPGTVPLTPEEPVTETVPLTVTLTVMAGSCRHAEGGPRQGRGRAGDPAAGA
jgi:hypothetical protein